MWYRWLLYTSVLIYRLIVLLCAGAASTRATDAEAKLTIRLANSRGVELMDAPCT